MINDRTQAMLDELLTAMAEEEGMFGEFDKRFLTKISDQDEVNEFEALFITERWQSLQDEEDDRLENQAAMTRRECGRDE